MDIFYDGLLVSFSIPSNVFFFFHQDGVFSSPDIFSGGGVLGLEPLVLLISLLSCLCMHIKISLFFSPLFFILFLFNRSISSTYRS